MTKSQWNLVTNSTSPDGEILTSNMLKKNECTPNFWEHNTCTQLT